MRLPKADMRGRDGPIHEDDVTLTKAFIALDEAQKEADRMNDLNGKWWSYSVNIARLVRDP